MIFHTRRWSSIIRVLVVLLVPILWACSSDSSTDQSPLDVARRYLDAERTGTYSAAYTLLTSDSQRKIGQTEYADRLSRARTDQKIASFAILSVGLPDPASRSDEAIIVGQRASVPYSVTITFADGSRQTLVEAMVLLKEEAGWRVVWPPA